MVTKIDTDKLEENILLLKKLQTNWKNMEDKPVDKSDNCGLYADMVIEVQNTLDKMQNSFITLIDNTILFMEHRKVSVETKEKAATETIIN